MNIGFQKSVYDSDGVSPTVREGHGDVVRITSRFGDKQSGGIYDKDGIYSTVHYGKREPFPHHIIENPSGTKTLHKNVPEIGEAERLYHPEGKSPPVKNHDIKILHNIYEGFDEDEPREFDDESLVIRTPKGGGHIPSVMEHKKITERTGEWGDGFKKDVSFCVDGSSDSDLRIHKENRIRKLTPVECERLQGFPDGWTEEGIDENDNEVEISDTQRYKMMGNAVTVNVIEFIGNRFIVAIEEGRI